jgi:basic membrane protein A and related proteins
MKRWIVVACALALLASGAGGQAASGASTLKIGMVTDVGGLNDRGFNHLAYVGMLQAQKRLGVSIRVAESRSPADYIPNLAAFARQGYDLVLGVGYTEIGAMGAVAKRFPKTRFAIVDVANGDLAGKPKNALGLLFHEEQVGYLAGYLAGLETKRLPGRDVVSSVAGEKQPPVDRFIAGYQAGAKRANPRVVAINGYSQDFNDQAKCKAIALNQIAAGSVAVFAVAGGCGLGALDAARERKVWGIGVDSDQSFLGAHILTSATKKVDRAVFLAIKSVADGRFHGGNAVYGLQDGGVGLGKISPRVPKAEVAALNRIQAQIVAGKIVPPKILR